MKFIFNDGGRAAVGYKGLTGDCVTRAIAIAAELPYQDVYDALAEGHQAQRGGRKSTKGKRTAAKGIYTSRKWFKDYMDALGWSWTPTMGIGTGCKVHLADGELPMGRLIVKVSRHYTAVIDGVICDTHNPQRSTGRCVYGYWTKP
jgi:hypothetical protein